MSAELVWYYQSAEIDTPLSINEGQTYTLVLKNIGDATAYNIGFYLSEGSIDPIAEIGTAPNIVYPSTNGTLIDLHNTLVWGETAGLGYTIYQGAYTDTFDQNTGNSSLNVIPLRVGPTNTDELAPNEEATVQVSIDAPIGTLGRMYLALDIRWTATD